MFPSAAILIRAMLCLALVSSAVTAPAASTDSAGYTMELMVSASGVTSLDSDGYEMFQVVSGPEFAHGLDPSLFEATPLSSDLFLVPVNLSTFSVE